MKSSIKKNYLYNLAYQILAMIVPLITTPYISRVLGAENIGIYTYTLSISAFFILFGSIGTSLYAQRQIAFYQNNKDEYSKIFWEIILVRLIGLGIAIILFVFSFVIKSNSYSKYYTLLVFELIGNLFDISWLYQGLEQFKVTVIRNSLVKIISIILIFLLIRKETDLYLYFIIYILSIVGGNVSLWFSFRKYIKYIKVSFLRPLKHLIPALTLFIPQIAIQVYTLLDRTMLGYLIEDKTEVGFYDQGQKLIKILISIVTSLGTVMLPRIASKFSVGDKYGIYESIYKSFQAVCMISIPMALGIFSVSREFVPFFYGDGFEPVINLLRIICPVIFFIGFSNVIGVQLLLPTKREKLYTISVIIGASVNFVANSLLIPLLGAVGASIGTVVAEGSVSIIQIVFVYKEISFRTVINGIWRYLLSGIIMATICIGINSFISGVTCLVVQIIIGMIVYGMSLYLFHDKMFLSLFPRRLREKVENLE